MRGKGPPMFEWRGVRRQRFAVRLPSGVLWGSPAEPRTFLDRSIAERVARREGGVVCEPPTRGG